MAIAKVVLDCGDIVKTEQYSDAVVAICEELQSWRVCSRDSRLEYRPLTSWVTTPYNSVYVVQSPLYPMSMVSGHDQ